MENAIPEFEKVPAKDRLEELLKRQNELDKEIQRIRNTSLASPELDPLINEAERLNTEYLRLKEETSGK